MKIKHTKNIGFMEGTPAAVSHADGTLYINDELFYRLTPFQQEFVRLHEIGHYRHHTHDEFEADRYAFNRIAGKYRYSLKRSIATLEKILDGDTEEQRQRIEAMYRMALRWDAEHGNRRAAEELVRLGEQVSRADGRSSKQVQAEVARGNSDEKLLNSVAELMAVTRQAENSGENTKTMMYMIMAIMALMILKK